MSNTENSGGLVWNEIICHVNGKSFWSWLAEFCTKWDLELLPFNVNQVPGTSSHDPTFLGICALMYNGNKIETTGTGRAKKHTQHVCAFKMLQKLGLTPEDLSRGPKRTVKPIGLLEKLTKVENTPTVYQEIKENKLGKIEPLVCTETLHQKNLVSEDDKSPKNSKHLKLLNTKEMIVQKPEFSSDGPNPAGFKPMKLVIFSILMIIAYCPLFLAFIYLN